MNLNHAFANTDPDAGGGSKNGDFEDDFTVQLVDFGHLAPAGTISDCEADGSVWSDAVYVPNPQLHHTATSKTHDEHTDVYINGELQLPDGVGFNNPQIIPTDPNQTPSPGNAYGLKVDTGEPYYRFHYNQELWRK